MKSIFLKLISNYSEDNLLQEKLWDEIEHHYSNKKRHYHTLSHLENLLQQLLEVKGKIENWNAILFSLYYHDVIYSALKSDNEEKSAALAERRMKEINVPDEIIKKCKATILATKTHIHNSNPDVNYFTDADLSILGQPWDDYLNYTNQIRKEYSVFPDLVYKIGRKKIAKHFLSMGKIFKTDYFRGKFEIQARENLQRELTFT